MNSDVPTIDGVQHWTAAVNGTRLHYVAAGGRGTPVLLVHGFPESWWAFRKLIPLLAARHRVYAVDLRGFGDSDVADESYSSAVAAEDVTQGGAWYIGALAAPGVAALLFEKEARAFVGDYLYPLYGVPDTAVSSEDVTEYARTYGRPGGFSGAAGLYRAMITEGQVLRALAQNHRLRIPVTTVGSPQRGLHPRSFQQPHDREGDGDPARRRRPLRRAGNPATARGRPSRVIRSQRSLITRSGRGSHGPRPLRGGRVA